MISKHKWDRNPSNDYMASVFRRIDQDGKIVARIEQKSIGSEWVWKMDSYVNKDAAVVAVEKAFP